MYIMNIAAKCSLYFSTSTTIACSMYVQAIRAFCNIVRTCINFSSVTGEYTSTYISSTVSQCSILNHVLHYSCACLPSKYYHGIESFQGTDSPSNNKLFCMQVGVCLFKLIPGKVDNNFLFCRGYGVMHTNVV